MANEVVIDGRVGSDFAYYPPVDGKQEWGHWRMVYTHRRDGKEHDSWFNVKAFAGVASHIRSLNLKKGDQVRVTGSLTSTRKFFKTCKRKHEIVDIVAFRIATLERVTPKGGGARGAGELDDGFEL